MFSKARRAGFGLVVVVAVALAAAGCGGGGSSSSSSNAASTPAGGASSTPAGGAGSGGAGEEAVTDYHAYIRGKAGKADSSKSLVYIGWVNQQGGQQSIGPAATDGADLAVKLVNDQLGGIGGAPVRLQEGFIPPPGG